MQTLFLLEKSLAVVYNKKCIQKGGRYAKDRHSEDFGGGGSVKPSQEKALH